MTDDAASRIGVAGWGWFTERGASPAARGTCPPALNEVGFLEDYFDGKNEALSKFWHVINKQLSEAA